MLPKRITELLVRYSKGECSPDETEELFRWYDQQEEAEAAVSALLDRDPQKLRQTEEEILAGLQAAGAGIGIKRPAQTGFVKIAPWLKYAAACLALLVIGYKLAAPPGIFPGPPEEITVSTPAGESRQVVLPDSSVVWLKPHSRVRYQADLNTLSTREVFFEGDGFFEVSHDRQRPFVVHASGVKIRVLGTSFNVRALSADSIVETALITGKVEIEAPGTAGQAPVVLAPGQEASFSKAHRKLEVNEMKPAAAAGSGTKAAEPENVPMVFRERPVSDVLTAIEKKFGLRVFYNEASARQCLITVDFEKENLDEILDVLQLSKGISYTFFRDELYLKGEFCNYP